MKVRITASGLPVPIGTIMEVGDAPPAAWRGKCEPLIVVPETVVPDVKEYLTTEPQSIDFDASKPFRRKRG